jgi:hypothetical protein
MSKKHYGNLNKKVYKYFRINNNMKLKLSKKTKQRLSELWNETKTTGKAVGKDTWSGLKATGKHIYNESPNYARGFKTVKNQMGELFMPNTSNRPVILKEKEFYSSPEHFKTEMSYAEYKRRLSNKGKYLDLRPKPRARRNPFDMI